jgi:hypothetical protein
MRDTGESDKESLGRQMDIHGFNRQRVDDAFAG